MGALFYYDSFNLYLTQPNLNSQAIVRFPGPLNTSTDVQMTLRIIHQGMVVNNLAYYQCRASDIGTLGTTSFSYDVVWTANLTHHFLNAERMRYMLRHSRQSLQMTLPEC